ncbi:hypothetical protein C5S31_06655 [ANME-1 cluster archaeon GoMg2]|nr:hypothetical protein [ANME-1 cluster archaeon GoMg2]
MASESIILPRKLGEKLKEKAKEAGYLPDELGLSRERRWENGDRIFARRVRC